MDTTEDDDIRLQKASASLITDLISVLDTILWRRRAHVSDKRRVHRLVRRRDLEKAIALIEPFQEEPQLLDTQLKTILPPLINAYLESLQNQATAPKPETFTISYGVCKILYTLCKVRGEKVITSFFNNEARYLEAILAAYEALSASGSDIPDSSSSWEERYVLLLWLYHLMLVPFDLASISSDNGAGASQTPTTFGLHPALPGIASRLLPACMKCLESATKEREAAALVLVRMTLRPDMRKTGLHDVVITWALAELKDSTEVSAQIHERLGILRFLSGLTASASPIEIRGHLLKIYRTCQAITDDDGLAPLRSSAVARKLIIKIFRNIILLCLQSTPPDLDTTTALEEVIEYLLNALADGDSPVRYAASKALSLITLKLDSAMADEVIEAILASLSEDVLWEGATRNFTAVNPLRWHGLTLTLGHLLYRRAPAALKLPDILNALVLSLQFEQRSATGSSIGTNVRDAACFGIWSLSRRYTTTELLAVDMKEIRTAMAFDSHGGVPFFLATQLLVAACLDPAGNIRRGSSAALQELVGRHPNIIVEGISLVQTVDYHAVGLRDRAMIDVAFLAGGLDQSYWDILFSALLEWRGVGAVDAASRAAAAKSIGRLCLNQSFGRVLKLLGLPRATNESLLWKIHALKTREVEERHGLLLAVAQVLNADDIKLAVSQDDCKALVELLGHVKSWNLPAQQFTSASFRPELTASAVCTLLAAATSAAIRADGNVAFDPSFELLLREASRLLQLCLTRSEPSVLSIVPACAKNLCSFPGPGTTIRDELVTSWLRTLKQSSRHVDQVAGHALALGAAFGTLPDRSDLQDEIVATLTARCTDKAEIEARVLALQALVHVVEPLSIARWKGFDGHIDMLDDRTKSQLERISEAIHTALNDYTVSDRGDVGSLVRLEALNTLERCWKLHILTKERRSSSLGGDVIRLSLEKLDKVRGRAKQCLESGLPDLSDPISDPSVTVSSPAYFAFWMKKMVDVSSPPFRHAILEGYVSSAGMGSESVVQVARAALLSAVDPLLPESNNQLSLIAVANVLMDVFKKHLENDRILLPLLEIIAFLLDMQILQRLAETTFKWRNLLSLVQKSHYKSNHMHKLHLALDVYRGLADVTVIRKDVTSKLVSMLSHPFPKLRVAAAETLLVVTSDTALKSVDWSMPTKALSAVIKATKERHVTSS
ncbi:hypothetical protein NA57DRAFT_63931 [Rhizodiscina lignyota]|uniref:Tubulin-specific chaperone D C-terminal domain-containing protein n=1 Tax=Rhizodiscina lignyota TaxID=1504668 RepID=A0A9P4MFA7_9PEZI|nr:hypothetical protein NA57DRAFT_63931 [Rhizodiscina lignyota]